MAPVKTWVVLNPKAGSGRARAQGARLAERMHDAVVVATNGPGDATRICREAVEQGIDQVVAVGGDGTLQQCVTGLCLDEHGQSRKSPVALALLPAGTGGDYRRTFDLKDSVDQLATIIESHQPIAVDVGLIDYTRNGAPTRAAFLNVLSFGLGGLVDQIVDRGPKWLGGRAAFFLGAVQATLVHRPVPLSIKIDGQTLETAPYSNVAVCIGKYFGGGMRIAPDAAPDDGLFDIVTMELSKMETLGLSTHIYRGTHFNQSGVKLHRGAVLEASTARTEPCLIDADGEQIGSLPLRLECLQGALPLLV